MSSEPVNVDEGKLEDVLTTIPLFKSTAPLDGPSAAGGGGSVAIKPNVSIVRPIPRPQQPIIVKDSSKDHPLLTSLEAQILRPFNESPKAVVVIPKKKYVIGLPSSHMRTV